MRDRKQEEREKALARVGEMPPKERLAAESAIAGKLAGMAQMKAAGSVMLYVSFGHEVDTHAIIRRLLAGEKVVALGRCRKDGCGLDAVVIKDFDLDLEPGYAGIPEPRQGLPRLAPEELGMVVVPLTAFGPDCSRLGRGKGFYDRFLAGLNPDCLKVGLAFECQKSEELPEKGHDVRLDAVITQNALYER